MKRSLIFIIPLLTMFFCIRDYKNPFDVSSNARTYIQGRTFPADTVPIYTTYACTLLTTVRELIDSISIHTTGNRFWTDTTLSAPIAGRYTLQISFCDTGNKAVLVITHRRDGDIAEPAVRVCAVSPLNQRNLALQLGTVCRLATPGVGDPVWYHWRFGRDIKRMVNNRFPQSDTLLDVMGQLPGALWVSEDSLGLSHPSPDDSFFITVGDAVPPELLCLNDSLRGDTIITGDNPFYFQIKILDEGGLKSVEIDGNQYPASQGLKSIRFANMTQYQGTPKSVLVRITDMSQNVTSDTFYLLFDPSISGAAETRIEITSMPGDTDTTRQSSFLLGGMVRDFRDSVALIFSVNQKPFSDSMVVLLSNTQGNWWHTMLLDTGWNAVRVRALGRLGDSLAQKAVALYFSPLAPDTKPPLITVVEINGLPVTQNGQNFTTDTFALVSCIALDESGIDTVTINGLPASADLQGTSWQRVVSSIRHDTAALVTITATDKTGKKSSYQFYARKNFRPKAAAGWRWLPNFIVGTQYTLPFGTLDDDQDSVRIENNPYGMALVRESGFNNWTLSWKPVLADTGAHTVRVVIDDGALDTLILWNFTVLRDSSFIVRLSNTSADFPDLLQTGLTWRDTLRIVPGTGESPYRCRAEFVSAAKTILDTTGDSSWAPFAWTPQMQDTGTAIIKFSVVDGFGDVASLYHTIAVVPRNADPCSVFVTIPAGLDMIGGAVDLRMVDSLVTLRFTIQDRDDPRTEHHRILVDGPGTVSFEQDSTLISFVINPGTILLERDTVRVTVSDSTGTTFTATVPLLFLKPLVPYEVNSLKAWLEASSKIATSDTTTEFGVIKRVMTWGALLPPLVSPDGILFGEGMLRPRYIVPDGGSGFPVVRFDGTACLINYYPNSTLNGWHQKPFTIIIAASLDVLDTTANNTLVSNASYFGLGVTRKGEAGIFMGDGSMTGHDSGSGLKVKQGRLSLFTFSSTGVSTNGNSIAVDIWLDGAAAETQPVLNMTIPGGYFEVGSNLQQRAASPWRGDIAEIIVYQGVLTELDRRGVERYLQWKYGLISK